MAQQEEVIWDGTVNAVDAWSERDDLDGRRGLSPTQEPCRSPISQSFMPSWVARKPSRS